MLWKRLDKDIWTTSQELGTHTAFDMLYENDIIDEAKLNSLKLNLIIEKMKVREFKRILCVKGFNNWSEPSKFKYLNELRKRVKRSPIRSRLAQLKNINTDDRVKQANTFLWHRDDSWFYELRINLSMYNENDAYGIEIENYGQKSFTPGNWYVWDTYVTHRPYVNQAMPGHARTNYVLAVNPWFDWIEEEQCWFKMNF